jgi:hypothetical protein
MTGQHDRMVPLRGSYWRLTLAAPLMLIILGARADTGTGAASSDPAAGMVLTFDEEFKDFSVSAHGGATRWMAHTPGNKDFGAAAFADPEGADDPFAVSDGVLRIRAAKSGGRWKSGLLASADPHGRGFSQQYGYFEIRAKFPPGPGTWPAFWLLSTAPLTGAGSDEAEIDVVEQYGHAPTKLYSTFHLWQAGKDHGGVSVHPETVGDMTSDFHSYGVKWDEATIAFYFDGQEYWRLKTPEAARTPMLMMVDLALGGGWPTDKVPDPSDMYVQRVRAYQFPNRIGAGR